MGAHESPESTLAAVETDVIRLHALRLVAEYESHDAAIDGHSSGIRMDRDAWLAWEGRAYGVLKDLARG